MGPLSLGASTLTNDTWPLGRHGTGVSVARMSQIDSGDVSTQDVLSRYIAALGGTLKLIADFGGRAAQGRLAIHIGLWVCSWCARPPMNYAAPNGIGQQVEHPLPAISGMWIRVPAHKTAPPGIL
jgi:hypothetical protein